MTDALTLTASQAPTTTKKLSASESFAAPPTEEHQKLKKVAQQFEGIFFQQLLEAMDKTVDHENSMFSGGQAEEMFRQMLNQNIATQGATQGQGLGLGIAHAMYAQMSQQLGDPALNPTKPDGLSMGAQSASSALQTLNAYQSQQASLTAQPQFSP